MHANHYEACRACGDALETPTTYRRHAYCPDCPDRTDKDSLLA